MAYSLYEETQLSNPKAAQYYPEEEYDYPSYYHKISEVKVNYSPAQSTRKTKKALASVNYVNERKCPIYVHQYNKTKSTSTYNSSPTKPPVEKPVLPKPKKIPGFPTTKSVLDQLEESYWATWKPNNKDNGAVTPRKHNDNKIKDYGDVPDVGGSYMSSEYEASTASATEESEYEKYNKNYETVINMCDVCETRKNPVRLKTTHTQEIQTDNVSMSLPKIEERVESDEMIKEEPHVREVTTVKNFEEKQQLIEKSSDEESAQETISKEKTKFLKHTDSFIIHKKKQSEVKEHFQQPKCIRLYRKPGISTSFIRGGTYPLKSCLKREPTTKGNFRLGPPGSPLFVSTSSFHKKSRK